MATQLRNLKILLRQQRMPKIGLDGASTLQLRVWPQEIDVNLHMNNSRYFAVADTGRLGFWVQAGWWPTLRARGWNPVAGDSNARYSRSLQPGEAYKLETRLLGWDEKWFFAEHRFVVKDRVCAVVLVRFLFTTAKGPRPTPDEVLAAVGQSQTSPALPPWVVQWSQAQDLLSAELKRGTQPAAA